MGMFKNLAKNGMFGLAGLAATNKDVTNKIARNGGLGLVGMLAAKKKAAQAGTPPVAGEPAMGGRFGTSDRGENTKEFKKGGSTKKKPMAIKKMAKGGSASRRADGCATKGKTKGKFV